MRRQRRRQRRVQDGERRAVERRIEPALEPQLVIRQHGGIARLAARRRDGEDRADGRGAPQLRALRPELPDVHIRVRRAVRHRLGGVDHAAAAHREDELCGERQRTFYALAGKRQTRVRLHAGQDIKFDLRRL